MINQIRSGFLKLLHSFPTSDDHIAQGSSILQGASLLKRHSLLQVVYPPTCVSCGVAVDVPHALCASCWSRLRFISRPLCERLGTPFEVDVGGLILSPAAISVPPLFQRARAAVCYDETARQLVSRFKYSDHMELGEALGRLMVQAGSELLNGADMLIPIPLHWTRLWKRRFNQAKVLADVVSKITKADGSLQVRSDVLIRIKATRHQTGLTRRHRAANLRGAFQVPSKALPCVKQKRIVLIDDVLTTGATVNAATRALLKAGAAHVDVLTFARVTLGDDAI